LDGQAVRRRRGDAEPSSSGGIVYPELNFTVPEITVINRETLPALKRQYEGIARGALERAVELHSSAR
jgi:hypothetical protein